MVRTPRHQQAPPDLLEKQRGWTRRWEHIRAGRKKGDWATAQAKGLLRRALESLAHGKCVYCECALDSRVEPEIDHYWGKAGDPARVFEWENLLPVCHGCNNAKGETEHGGLLLKPDGEDPEPYFSVEPNGDLVPALELDEAGKRRALKTIGICKLGSGKPFEARYNTWQRVGRWLDRARRCHGRLSAELAAELEELLRPGAAHKFVIRYLFRLAGRADLAAEDRRRFEAPPQTTR
jgi:uncharacterized protein (TIGR02646 family)